MSLAVGARSLLKVSVKESDEADTLFGELMGNEVEPRREFIAEHAPTASAEVKSDASLPDARMLK